MVENIRERYYEAICLAGKNHSCCLPKLLTFNQSRVDVPPHIFATAESAYRSMILDDELQCVIISGKNRRMFAYSNNDFR